MSRAHLPRTEVYLALVSDLRFEGYRFREEMGGKHGRLIVSVNGREEVIIVSTSPSDRHASKNASRHLRRRIREWKAEAAVSLATETAPARFPTLEKETMDDSTVASPRSTDVIEVLGRQITKVEYKGQRVVTLRQIDEAHEKADGQARKQYNAHKDRFGDGVDYFELTSSEIRTMSAAGLFPERTARGMLFTERGYGKIVKGWNDDLSWQLHDAMQDAYFAAKSGTQISAPPDDTAALLDMLADIQSAVISAQQSGAATALEHIDGAKAAVLHYLKAYLKEPAQAFYEDVRHRNTAAYQRDVILKKEMSALAGEVRELLSRAKPSTRERPFLWSEWYDAARIYSEEFPGQAIPKQQFLSQAVALALDSMCKRTRQFHSMEQRIIGGRPKNFWHREIVQRWLNDGGRKAITAHIARHGRPSNVVLIAGTHT